VTYSELQFEQDDTGMQNLVAARGAVETVPVEARTFWYGTRLKLKPDFRGVLRSQPFIVQSRYLTVPFTGFPCFPGNGLRVRFIDPVTKKEAWESYVGNDAGTSWNLWTLDASAYQGAEATLFLYDGHDGPKGWLGVARPAQTDDSAFSTQWRAHLRLERAHATHRTIAIATLATGVISLALWLWLLIQGQLRRPQDRDSRHSPPDTTASVSGNS
jgi:hypothetical protein